jgi:hypothetical protein
VSDFFEPRTRINLPENINRRVQETIQRNEEDKDYYSSLREKYNDMPGLSNRDYDFLEHINPVISSAPDPEDQRDRILSAAILANSLHMPIDAAYLNLDEITRQWTGMAYTPKKSLKAIADSARLSILAVSHNAAAALYRMSKQDPQYLKLLEQIESQMEGLKDNIPKVWQEEYVRQGGFKDIENFLRSITVSAAENIAPVAMGGASGSLGGLAMASAAGLANARNAPRRAELLEEIRTELEKELEKHPEVSSKDLDEILKDIGEAAFGDSARL